MNKELLEQEKIFFKGYQKIFIHFNSYENDSIEGFTKLTINRTTVFGCKYSDIIKSEDVIGDIKRFVKEMFIEKLHPSCYQYDYQVIVGSSGLEIYNSKIDNMCTIFTEMNKESVKEL